MKVIPIKFFLLVLFTFVSMISLFFIYLHGYKKETIMNNLRMQESHRLEILGKKFCFKVRGLVSDIKFLKNAWLLQHALLNNFKDKENIKSLEADLVNFAYEKDYFQIRITDINGLEIVKIVHDENSNPQILKVSEMQNKNHRLYFKQILKLKDNQIYFSKVELNKEHNEVSLPITPVVRVAVKLQNKQQEYFVIMNYSTKKMLENIGKDNKYTQMSVLNKEGFWLYNSKDSLKSFAFMYGKDIRFSKDHPDIWSLISDNKNIENSSYSTGGIANQFISKDNIFTYTKVNFNAMCSASNIKSYDDVYIVSSINKNLLSEDIWHSIMYIYFISLIFIVGLSWFICRFYSLKLKKRKLLFEISRRDSVLSMIVTANHELNQPLAIIKSLIDMLNKKMERNHSSIWEEMDDTKGSAIICRMKKNVNKMNEILKKYQTKDFDFSNYYQDIKMVSFKDEDRDGVG